MKNFARVLVVAAALAAPFAPVVAQAPLSGSVFHLTPYAGTMVFGNYLSGPLGTSVSNKPGLLYGAQIGMSLAPNLSLVGNIGYTSSDIDIGVPILGGVSVGNSSTLLYDADLEYDVGKVGTSAISPFIQAGVGQMKYNINAASVLTTNATNVAGNVGVGADFALSKGMALRVMAKDYIGKFNFQDATGFDAGNSATHNFGLTAGLRFDF